MATPTRKNATDLGDQAIALAEQLGRIAGTIGGRAESWMNTQQLTEQLARVRDGANQMLESLMSSRNPKPQTRKPAGPARTRRADPSRAPGKRRRKPVPSMKGVKKSDERIPKLRTATAVRQRRKSYA